MESQLETRGRWKVCNGKFLAAIVTTEVMWVFSGEYCTSLLEKRTELKEWEAEIVFTFPKGHTWIWGWSTSSDPYVRGLIMFISDLGAEVTLCSSARWALLAASQWERLADFGGDNLENSPQKCCHHQYGEWHSGLHYEEWSNPVKGGYYSHHHHCHLVLMGLHLK